MKKFLNIVYLILLISYLAIALLHYLGIVIGNFSDEDVPNKMDCFISLTHLFFYFTIIPIICLINVIRVMTHKKLNPFDEVFYYSITPITALLILYLFINIIIGLKP